MKTSFNNFGVLSTKAAAPSSSWWALPELQHDRAAFEKRLVDEELRMVGSRFGGRQRIIDKFPAAQKKR